MEGGWDNSGSSTTTEAAPVKNRLLQQKLVTLSSNFLRTNQFGVVQQELERLATEHGYENMDIRLLARMKQQMEYGVEWLLSHENEIAELITMVESKITSAKKRPAKEVAPKRRKRSKAARTTTLPPHQLREPRINDQVAAKVSSHNLWILTTVKKHHASQDIWEVVDDDDQSAEERHHFVKRNCLLVLASEEESAAGSGLAEHYPVGTRVLAMYPETTSFYQATISAGVFLSVDGKELCVVQFDDDEDETGQLPHREVPVRFIAVPPDG
uniref:SGF29 C-terminal domain-containing protein n=1 Tax=Fibrocapsa japonica TaxID=94617 RepID=A0A7S2V2U9_9STRA|mmetsp:Transcript_4725/g.7047  ORF Transcript_4725/g.7047 Transcript_4725/m.7047 type:complete len:270 (+) Transcript_4725:190-999(+)|eukprot:CAMPEP_0113943228 /NCGR_PEP_ID=MMETSP1339-20121228/21388_1 /TAXON_ID=94617 /ORGANISM="Fibrocapsa japonica" /LENGTH=269 /DNA_ID=CAMNT_0000948045 /DNA_START=127 /DNA_END=936 /DNA_ORIENTATION=+ /assembly_acc=CAM_ASM_000762